MSDPESRAVLSPSALPLTDAARVLTRLFGKPIGLQMLQADLANGAPRNSDGTLNLVHYAAWLVREMGHAD